MGVSKNRGIPPKWMVKIMENPIKMDDLGGKPTIFGNIHISFGYFSKMKGGKSLRKSYQDMFRCFLKMLYTVYPVVSAAQVTYQVTVGENL